MQWWCLKWFYLHWPVHFRCETIKLLKCPVWKRLLEESGHFGDLRIQNSPLLFRRWCSSLAPSACAGTLCGTCTESKAMVLCKNKMWTDSHWVEWVAAQGDWVAMYSGSSFMGVGKMNLEVKCQIVAVSKAVQALDRTNVVKKKKAELEVFYLPYKLHYLHRGHELWVVTKRDLWIHPTEVSCLCRAPGFVLRVGRQSV